jgi:hypothetical protein
MVVKDLLKNTKHFWKKLGKTRTNGKISCIHRLEGLVLFKYPYYPKLSTDSMQ